MPVPFVDLSAQVHSLRRDIDAALARVIDRTAFILGPEVEAFEEAFADFIGVGHAIGVGSGLSALELSLLAHGIGPGDEVIAPTNTFIATVSAIANTGATPVLVDMDPDTYTISVPALAAAISPRTAALMPVHLYGLPADMDPILSLAARHGLAVIEDAAQAHGARYRGRRVGSLGQAAGFSFYPAKNLGAFGDAGMVLTPDAAVAEQVRRRRNYGQQEKYLHNAPGTNSRLDTLQAAVLCVSLPHLDDWNAARGAVAARYAEVLQDLPVQLPQELEDRDHVYHLYVLQVDDRDRVRADLEAKGISSGIHYPVPVHLQPCFHYLGYRAGDFPVAEAAAARLLSLPMFPFMTRAQVDEVARVLRDAAGGM